MQAYDFVELFAGKGFVSACVKGAGFSTASLDITYHQALPQKQNFMDVLTPAGMALLMKIFLKDFLSSM